MRLTVVGCSGSFPGPDSAASCYLVEAEGFRLVLDLGNGALGALARHLDVYTVDAVALSHLHADHCLDLCSLYVARAYHPDRTFDRLPVWGPAGTAARLARAYDMPVEPGMRGQFDVHAFPSEPFAVGPFTVRIARVAHPVEAYALRVEHGGRSLVYSGDTGPTPALVKLADGADLLLAEASFGPGDDHPPGLHLTGRQAGEHAAAAGVGRLVVTHVPPWGSGAVAVEEARTAYDGPVELAAAGQEHDV